LYWQMNVLRVLITLSGLFCSHDQLTEVVNDAFRITSTTSDFQSSPPACDIDFKSRNSQSLLLTSEGIKALGGVKERRSFFCCSEEGGVLSSSL